MVVGPMGSGKTEYSSRVWRDSQVAQQKSASVGQLTVGGGEADRRKVFFIRSRLDAERFPSYPSDALAYRGGFERCGQSIAAITDSFELEEILAANPSAGTWIIDEAAFYDERIAYVISRESEEKGLVFIFPSLILNFRKEIFNSTARLLLDITTDIFPLTAYCEHPDCIEDSFYTYRYYLRDGRECPALYFDPLIIVGGDRTKDDPREPNYCTRCDAHHFLPGKEYTFLTLKPLGEQASGGDIKPLQSELDKVAHDMTSSLLHRYFHEHYEEATILQALDVPCVAERAVVFLYAEQNLLSRTQVLDLMSGLDLDEEYIVRRLSDNRRPL